MLLFSWQSATTLIKVGGCEVANKSGWYREDVYPSPL
jgi:hypothetical protein